MHPGFLYNTACKVTMVLGKLLALSVILTTISPQDSTAEIRYPLRLAFCPEGPIEWPSLGCNDVVPSVREDVGFVTGGMPDQFLKHSLRHIIAFFPTPGGPPLY